MTVKDLKRILGKWSARILLLSFAATAVAGLYYYTIAKDYYTTTAKIYTLFDYMGPAGNMMYDVTTSAQFSDDFKELILTPEVLTATEDALGIQFTDSPADIDVVSVTDTRVISIVVTSQDPVICMRVANTLSTVFADRVKKLTGMDAILLGSQAVLPEKPAGPNRVRNCAFVFLASLLVSFSVALVVDMLDTRIRSRSELERHLRLTVLAEIADYRRQFARFIKRKNNRKSMEAAMPCLTLEGVNRLWANMQYAAEGKELRTVSILSATRGEGKSSLLLLLAQIARKDGKRVLLVDLDLRNPALGRYLKAHGKYDLIDFLSGRASLDEILIRTDSANLSLVNGRQCQREMSSIVGSERFATFLSAVRQRFDHILFDTPPVGLFVDAAILSSYLDGVALVLANGKVEGKTAQEALEQLWLANANVLGSILNYTHSHREKHAVMPFEGEHATTLPRWSGAPGSLTSADR